MDVETPLGKEIPAADSAGARIEAGDEPGVGVEVPSPFRTMTPFWKVDWAALRTVRSGPIEFLRRRGFRLYVRIDTERCVAFAYRALQSPYEGLTAKGFAPKIAYLALDNKALSEIAVSSICNRAEFTEGGLIVVEGNDKEPSSVQDVVFQRCYVLNKIDKLKLEMPTLPPGPNPDYREYAMDLLIRQEDLWLEESDLAQIREIDLSGDEFVDYPYGHRGQVPAVYWMFQAAYALNCLGSLSKGKVLQWLRAKDANLFSDKRGKLAAKFVAPYVDRAKGRGKNKGAKPFDMVEFCEWTQAENFTFPYVGIGLSLILGVTDWWVALRPGNEPEKLGAKLVYRLRKLGFDEQEIKGLYRLIAGVNLTKFILQISAEEEAAVP